jgi:hypothetical protein
MRGERIEGGLRTAWARGVSPSSHLPHRSLTWRQTYVTVQDRTPRPPAAVGRPLAHHRGVTTGRHAALLALRGAVSSPRSANDVYRLLVPLRKAVSQPGKASSTLSRFDQLANSVTPAVDSRIAALRPAIDLGNRATKPGYSPRSAGARPVSSVLGRVATRFLALGRPGSGRAKPALPPPSRIAKGACRSRASSRHPQHSGRRAFWCERVSPRPAGVGQSVVVACACRPVRASSRAALFPLGRPARRGPRPFASAWF